MPINMMCYLRNIEEDGRNAKAPRVNVQRHTHRGAMMYCAHLPWTDNKWLPNIFFSSPSSTFIDAKLQRQLYMREFLRNRWAQGSRESYIC